MQMLPLTVVYTAGDETIGTQVLKANGLEGEEHTFTSKELVAPENYEFVEAFAGYPVAYGANAEVTVEVRKIELPTPGDEEADATLHISYIFNYRELANQDITVRGKKGESYTFTSENVSLEIPTGYKLKKPWIRLRFCLVIPILSPWILQQEALAAVPVPAAVPAAAAALAAVPVLLLQQN